MLVVKPEERIKVKDIRKHPWFLGKSEEVSEAIPTADQGLMVGYNHISIDNEILKELEELGIDAKQAK